MNIAAVSLRTSPLSVISVTDKKLLIKNIHKNRKVLINIITNKKELIKTISTNSKTLIGIFY
jgi:hypothetical protein